MSSQHPVYFAPVNPRYWAFRTEFQLLIGLALGATSSWGCVLRMEDFDDFPSRKEANYETLHTLSDRGRGR